MVCMSIGRFMLVSMCMLLSFVSWFVMFVGVVLYMLVSMIMLFFFCSCVSFVCVNVIIWVGLLFVIMLM